MVVAMLTLLGLTLVRPIWGLAVSGMILYNPLFNFRFLYLEEFRGGSVRASASFVVMLVLLAALVLRGSPLRVSLRWRHGLFIGFLAVGAITGLLRSNSLRLIASDLFPAAEFTGFYLLASNLIQSEVETRQLIRRLMAWATVAAVFDLGLYALHREVFLSHFALAGSTTIVRRIDDFMPALLLPTAISFLLLEPRRRTQVAYMISALFLTGAVAFSFFRSLYAGVLAATLVILVLIFFHAQRQRRVAILRLGLFLVIGLGVAVVASAVVLKTVAFSRQLSIIELVADRIRYVETTSGTARLVDNMDLLKIIIHNPLLGIGLGGKEGALPLFSTSNYYLSLAAELGIPAFLSFIWIAFKFSTGAFHTYRSNESVMTQAVTLAVVGAFVSMAVTLLTFPALLHYPIPVYLAMLAASLPQLGPPKPDVEPGRSGGRALAETRGSGV
jgi:hypothetical protein